MRSVGLLLLLLPLVLSPAAARPRHGALLNAAWYKPAARWVDSVGADGRAHLQIPINVVRIYSSEHSAEQIAPRRWLTTQLHVANALFRYAPEEMKRYGPGKPAPLVQFTLNKVYDVHEQTVTRLLGVEMDSENLLGGRSKTLNGRRLANTWDLRTLKVAGATQYMTVYCVWEGKNTGHKTEYFGGESNVGFNDRPFGGPDTVLTRAGAVASRMGVVSVRHSLAYMSNLAHEFGHYFGLFHAWDHVKNRQAGITDLGAGPQGKVDPDPLHANVMDYDHGPQVREYFALSQLDYIYRFARDKVASQILVHKSSGQPEVRTPAPAPSPAARLHHVRVAVAGGAVTVHTRFEADRLQGQQGEIVAWFYDDHGQRLRDVDGRYRSRDGQVSVGDQFRPGQARATYDDFKLVLPGDQLHVGAGAHRLSVVVGLFAHGKLLARSASTTFYYTVARAPAVARPGAPAAWLSGTTAETGVLVGALRHVRVRTTLQVDNMPGQDLWLTAYFHFEGGQQLKDYDGQYAVRGMVATWKKLKPAYARTTYSGLELLIPESQLHLARGAFRMYAGLAVTSSTRQLASGRSPGFVLGTRAAVARPRQATIERVWLTHNIAREGQTGLEVNLRFRAVGYLGRSLQVVAYFYYQGGKKLKDFDGKYRTVDGQVSASTWIKPAYEDATYHTLKVFLPYPQLHMAAGRSSLEATVTVFDGQTAIAKSAGPTRFWYNR